MIEIELPDGTIAEFPDGTSNDVIKGALQKRFSAPTQPQGPERSGDARRRGQSAPSQQGQKLDDYYSSGIYSGQYNPLGPIARSIDAASTFATDAATLGYADEALGLFSGDARDEMRDRQEAIGESNPIASTVGSVGGGVALASRLGPASVSNLASNAGLGWRALAGAADGGLMGGLYGFGSGEGLSDRATQAAQGGLIGGLIGGALPVVSAGAGRAYEAIANRVRANPIAQQAGTTPEALRTLGNVIDADGSLTAGGRQNMARAGQEAMLADAGPTARGVLDTAIQRSGPGGRIASEAVDDRVARDSARLVGALDNTLGTPQGVTAARTAIRDGSSGARSSAYNRAYSQPIDYAAPQAREMEAIVRNRVPASAINRANELMRINGEESSQILARVADDGTVAFERLPDVRQLDYITKALNDVANDAQGTGALGGTSQIGRAYEGLSRDIRSRLRNLVPAYGEALETAADPIRRSQAVDMGSRLLSRNVTRDQLAETVRGMTGPERQALAQGVRSNIDDAMASVQRTVMDNNVDAREAISALKSLSSRANREKLAMVVGDDQAASLFNEVDRIAQSFELRAAVADNSRTFGRGAIADRVKETSGADSILRTAQRGEGIGATKRFVQALTGETPESAVAREDVLYSELARLLTQRGGAGQNVYNAVTQIGQTDAATALMKERIVRALAGPHLSYPLGTQSQRMLQ